MTRIGFVYNQKPDLPALRLEDSDPQSEDEPPSRGTGDQLRAPRSRSGSHLGVENIHPRAASTPPSRIADQAPASAAPDDEFAEWDGPETIAAVERALSALGEVVRLEANAEFPERLRDSNVDIAFNIAEGLRGPNREAHVPAICEYFGVPYSGSDPFTLSLCLDKARTKECLAYHGVPTAPFTVVRSLESGELRSALSSIAGCSGTLAYGLRFPLFVKPVHEGSSKGITERNYCRDLAELESQVAFLLEKYRQPVLVEEYLPGAEFTCAVLGNGDAARVLPIVGMRYGALPPGALPVYGFEAKWLWDRPENPLEIFECPARVDDALGSRIEQTALAAYRVLGCRDWSRVDVRLDAAGVPNVVEVNPLPGILPDPADNSCLPKAARAAGMSYDELIQACARHAAERQGVALPSTLARGDAGDSWRTAVGGAAS
jgi:D-alanine-D-alanine ligase